MQYNVKLISYKDLKFNLIINDTWNIEIQVSLKKVNIKDILETYMINEPSIEKYEKTKNKYFKYKIVKGQLSSVLKNIICNFYFLSILAKFRIEEGITIKI